MREFFESCIELAGWLGVLFALYGLWVATPGEVGMVFNG